MHRPGDSKPGCPGCHRYSLMTQGLTEEETRAIYDSVRPFWESMWEWQRCGARRIASPQAEERREGRREDSLCSSRSEPFETQTRLRPCLRKLTLCD